ncbi:MAG TPA: glutamate racemase, partial [Aggregatilineales bacterium]|nr:glutamate racemase [Aggregatilineales bacterium]
MNGKIGVFDSGVGGLSVLREIHRLLPNIPTVYFADQKHVPYGPRPHAQIYGFVRQVVEFLIEQGAEVIVLACHAGSAASLYPLREAYPHIPFVGIEPAVKPASIATKSGVIGV